MTTVYIKPDQKDETISCSDGSHGAMVVAPQAQGEHYEFTFYGHAHPTFWLTQSQFHDGEQLRVRDMVHDETFKIHFIK